MNWTIKINTKEYQVPAPSLEMAIEDVAANYMNWLTEYDWEEVFYGMRDDGGTYYMDVISGTASNELGENFKFSLNGQIVVDIDYCISNIKAVDVTDPLIKEELKTKMASNHPDQLTIPEVE